MNAINKIFRQATKLKNQIKKEGKNTRGKLKKLTKVP